MRRAKRRFVTSLACTRANCSWLTRAGICATKIHSARGASIRLKNECLLGTAAPSLSNGSGSAYPTSGFTFGGLRPRSNSISLDGFSNNDAFNGESRTELSPEIVKEFQIVNHGLSAQYGGSPGGSVNVVTGGGANTQHGNAFPAHV